MRILSYKSGFASDHSSTSYQFLAVDKTLGKKEKEEVATLPGGSAPSARRIHFVFPGEDGDIPGGWLDLMTQYYDVMYREEYDWWTLAVAFSATDEQIAELNAYEFSDGNGAGVSVDRVGNRAIISIECWIDFASVMDPYDESEDEDGTVGKPSRFTVKDRLLRLLIQVRRQLIAGDYRTLYAVWEEYGDCNDDESVPVPQTRTVGEGIVDHFRSILVTL